MNQVRLLVIVLLALWPIGLAVAKELSVQGEAAVPITSGNPQDIRARALRAAKRKAVVAAVDQVLGPNASLNPKVAPKIDAVVAQIPDSALIDQKATRIENNFQVQVHLVLDDKTFRTLLSDQGIAINTTEARASSLLAIMDEFITDERDLKAPLAELVEYRSSVGASVSDRSSSATAVRRRSAVAEQAQHQGVALTPEGVGAVAGRRARVGASETVAATATQTDVDAEVHNDQYYRRLVRYQPRNPRPEKVSQTYNALVGQLQDYDLRMMDNDVFRSRHFARPVTLEDMGNSAALTQYVSLARSEAKADFFLVGTSVIVDSSKSRHTGESVCSGLLSLKTYSTQSGESIASETVSETASGIDANACAANLARKLARTAGAYIGSRVQDYWKRRLAYGREYVLTLRGAGMTLGTRTAFARAIKALPGVDNATQRTSDNGVIELTVSYKGKDPLDQAVAEGLAGNPAFSALDAVTDGTHIVFCFGPCRPRR